jgi:hypothetical protein
MGRACTICHHPDREAIDSALVAGETLRVIGERHGLRKDALSRHRASHAPLHLAKIERTQQMTTDGTVRPQIAALVARAETVLDHAEATRRPTVALAAIREMRQVLETLGRITGELDAHPTAVVNVLMSNEWHEVRTVILQALMPFPEAADAVRDALARVAVG